MHIIINPTAEFRNQTVDTFTLFIIYFLLSCRMNKQHLQLSAIFFYLVVFVNASGWMACPELSPALRLPCKCQMEQISVNGQSGSVGMDCDRIVFTSDTPQIPSGAPISTFSQRYSGAQALPTQVMRSGIYYDDQSVVVVRKRRKIMIGFLSLVKLNTFGLDVKTYPSIICKFTRCIVTFHIGEKDFF